MIFCAEYILREFTMAQSSDPNIPSSKSLTEKDNPEVRKLWWVTLFVQIGIGITNGLYLYTWGPYLYEKFSADIQPSTAMILLTVLLGIRQGLVALLEVPTGALADTIGRVHVVILSWVARVLFFVCLAAMWFCQSVVFAFMWSVFASIAFAISYTLFNGAFSAWCAEVIREKQLNITYGWLASRFYSYQSVSIAAGGIVAVICYLHQLAFVGFIAAAFIAFCGVGYCMGKMQEVSSLHFLKTKEVQFTAITRRIGEIIGRAAQACSRTPVLFWIILTYGSYMFLLNLVVYLWPVFFKAKYGSSETLGRDWIFIVVSAQLLSTLSSRILVKLNKRWTRNGGVSSHLAGFRRIFVLTALISSASILLLSWNTFSNRGNEYFVFPIAVIVVMLSFGIIAPCFETLVNAYIPPQEIQERATIISAGSMFRSFLVLLLAVPSGGSSGETSPINWAIPAVLLLVSVLIANVFMRRAAKEKEVEVLGAANT